MSIQDPELSHKERVEMRRRKRLPGERPAAASFPVIVEREIGRVEIGGGDEHPFVVAMKVVAEHALADGLGAATDSTYRFADASEGTVRVQISVENNGG